MSGIPKKLKQIFIPFPRDGINLIEPPIQKSSETSPGLLPTEANELLNYYIENEGIRQRAAILDVSLPNTGTFFGAYAATSDTDQIFLISIQGHLYKWVFGGIGNPGTFTTLSTVAAEKFRNAFTFNKMVFMPFAEGSDIGTYNLETDTYANSSFTVPVGFETGMGFVFKNRCYFINNGTNSISYGGVDAISGALTNTGSFASVFQRGRYIRWGASWSFNQGQTNEELFVIGNDAGDVLIYSGDYPAAANWQLITRITIPPPVDGKEGLSSTINATNPVLKYGQELIIITARGVISLRQVLAGLTPAEQYFSISRKLSDRIIGDTPALSTMKPFAYFIGWDDYIYVLNYERNAWSRFDVLTGGTEGAEIKGIVCSTRDSDPIVRAQNTTSLFVFFTEFTGQVKLSYISENPLGADLSYNYIWKTPFFDFGDSQQKTSKYLRVITRDYLALSSSFSLSTGVVSDLNTSTTTTTTQSITTGGAELYGEVELAAAGIGRRISYVFKQLGNGSTNIGISGFYAFIEEGGVY